MLQQLTVATRDRSGEANKVALNLYWKPARDRDRAIMQVVSPESLKGASYLLVETMSSGKHFVYMYLPSVGQVRKLEGEAKRESILGTEISYTELKLLQGRAISEKKTRKQDDQEIVGRSAYVLQTDLDSLDLPFSRVRTFVDKSSCTVLGAELYEGDSDKPAKVLTADPGSLFSVEIEGKRVWIMRRFALENMTTGNKTTLDWGELDLSQELPSALFEPEHFYKASPRGGGHGDLGEIIVAE